VLQCVPVCCGVFLCVPRDEAHEAAVTAASAAVTMLLSGICMLQCVAVCTSVLRCVSVCS